MAKLYRVVNYLIIIGMFTTSLWCSTTKADESTGQYVDDSVITTKVKAAILDDMSLKGFHINVKTYKGVVQLSGFVDSADNASKAGDIAHNIKGVKNVKNDLIVK